MAYHYERKERRYAWDRWTEVLKVETITKSALASSL